MPRVNRGAGCSPSKSTSDWNADQIGDQSNTLRFCNQHIKVHYADLKVLKTGLTTRAVLQKIDSMYKYTKFTLY